MQHPEYQYLNLMKDILENGVLRGDRTGTGTLSVFGRQIRFDLSKGFPLLTTKRVSLKLVASELLWFIKGDTNIRYLLQHNNYIWVEWAFKNWVESDEYTGPDMSDFGRRATTDPEFNEIYQEELKKFCKRILEDDEFSNKYGSIGEGAYGAQWRRYKTPNGETIDQLKEAIEAIKHNQTSRRILVNSWGDYKNASLPPCHYAFQFYVAKGKLSCMFSMRSTDSFLGLPYNICSYGILTHMIAQECNLEVGELIYTGADVHIYSNHIEQVNTQLEREPRKFPTLVLNPEKESIFDFDIDDIVIENYNPHPAIKAPVAV